MISQQPLHFFDFQHDIEDFKMTILLGFEELINFVLTFATATFVSVYAGIFVAPPKSGKFVFIIISLYLIVYTVKLFVDSHSILTFWIGFYLVISCIISFIIGYISVQHFDKIHEHEDMLNNDNNKSL